MSAESYIKDLEQAAFRRGLVFGSILGGFVATLTSVVLFFVS